MANKVLFSDKKTGAAYSSFIDTRPEIGYNTRMKSTCTSDFSSHTWTLEVVGTTYHWACEACGNFAMVNSAPPVEGE